MNDRAQWAPEIEASQQWRELRDDRDKLCGRIDSERMLLEIRRNRETAVFDLRDYIDMLRGIAIETEMR